jgi:hypothetical protein
MPTRLLRTEIHRTEYASKKHLDVEHIFQITESSSKDTRKQFDKIITLIRKSSLPLALITDTVNRLQRSFRETPILDELRKQGKLELHFLRKGLYLNKNSNSSALNSKAYLIISIIFMFAYGKNEKAKD